MDSSDKELIHIYYKKAAHEDERFAKNRISMMESYYTKKYLIPYISPYASVIELACGTGLYGMFLANRCRQYHGIDKNPENIEIFRRRINKSGFMNLKAELGDILQIEHLPSNSHDIVLVLGPMYHLPIEHRDIVFRESRRICKNGGIIAYSYINKVGISLTECFLQPETYPSRESNENILVKGIDEITPEVYFFTMPEEIEKMAAVHGLSVLKNVGLNFSFNMDVINAMTTEQFNAWMQLTDFMSGSGSCTGVSSHALMICRKDSGLESPYDENTEHTANKYGDNSGKTAQENEDSGVKNKKVSDFYDFDTSEYDKA